MMVQAQVTIRDKTFAIDVPVEFDIERLFDAMNGYFIADHWTEYAADTWCSSTACSMSSGDSVLVHDINGKPFARFTAEPVGWKVEKL